MTGRRGKQLEAQAKNYLKEYFQTPLVFKLINTERMDFIVVDSGGSIQIVEAKQTKSKFYNPKSSPKKREQLFRYFEVLAELRKIDEHHWSKFHMLVRLRGKLVFNSYETLADIPTRIEVTPNGDIQEKDKD
jgi:hypothetical protein